ncbi:hypothetical protein DV451_002459 [Geotrichum candidum]|uniref:RRM domain-containing protein n=1 Tax=Geotrichum candidum TaxID=1173061 RepID=A0A9P5G5S9_GEOCN|nr:hypothetical protein DV451_002459 [Geotrichum candidum]KAI9214064.1 hypothetical protein DS838_001102 [Geotrichum bryndzae]KAF5111535.1 hypothetical protein DV453_000180 [Geotrichum candidum]KAF5115901.1 hypothetical protein DV454_001969 [Geotrichum candidum]KAF5120092.1 hypothetical protein DV452_001282 [Geotrichum candidum]
MIYFLQSGANDLFLAGNVVFADVLTTPNGRSKGCGIVEYATREEAERAIEELNNVELDGRPVFVREDRETEPKFNHNTRPQTKPQPAAEGSQLFVNNLPYSVQWRELKDLFSEVGEVSRADVILDQRGRSKGHGTVAFSSPDAAKAAIEKFDGYELEGRPLEVREDKFSNSRPFPPYAGRVNNRRGGFKPQAPRFRFNRPPPNPFTDRATGNGEPSATIFVSNLPWATTDNDLVELFRTVGPVKRAQIKLEPSGRSAGTGVVEFFEPIHAETSIARFTNYEYGGRPLSLSFVSYYAAPAPRAPKYKESSEVNAAEPEAEAKPAAAAAAPAAPVAAAAPAAAPAAPAAKEAEN